MRIDEKIGAEYETEGVSHSILLCLFGYSPFPIPPFPHSPRHEYVKP